VGHPPLARWIGRWRGTWTLCHLEGEERCLATLEVQADALHYRWTHEGRVQTGHLQLEPLAGRKAAGTWGDSWLADPPLRLEGALRARGLELEASYPATGELWTWRITLREGPVMEMVDVSPDGRERRVVRFVAGDGTPSPEAPREET